MTSGTEPWTHLQYVLLLEVAPQLLNVFVRAQSLDRRRPRETGSRHGALHADSIERQSGLVLCDFAPHPEAPKADVVPNALRVLPETRNPWRR